ncbi:ATP-binding protein [Acidaminobacter hydrogenoformans]|uniref:AAA+ ATPase domain-containing protein n=1 Tax=Acidaminobacter hydrogenoformans DSM 2784 TaxID=1120920 RepID=A0A1G5RZH0_9FIRM|nr:DUF4143 domain-containing protein [Acidaminobacter hydrogenoformans]SCZ78719.1 hypothetical protein SAMN03080599_01400 [Acidaminobacter hydrogenoformans DSM 2784]
MGEYLPRIADQLLQKALLASGAVLIEGPKWCGKTRTASEAARSVLYMQDPDKQASHLQAASLKPSLLLQGDTPRLIDEWQMAPVLWDAVRFMVDQRDKTGQFILTGSAVPADNIAAHTGTGRISRLRMRTMSLFESLDSNGTVSLLSLFNHPDDISGINSISIERLSEVISRGGWPASIGIDPEIAEKRVQDYVDAVIQQDISRVDNVEKSPDKVRALMRSIARNISTEATLTTLKRDMEGFDESISLPTVSSYLNALSRIFVIEDLPAWNPSLRSKTPLRTSSKRHFTDPSIAVAVMGVTSKRLLHDFNTFGYLFESLCIRDLRVYAEAIGGSLYHFRAKTGLESDAVLVLRDGRWAAIEVKMGANEFDLASENLFKFSNRIDTDKMGDPSFLMILTATEFAYKREDGVYVVPLGCLKP